MVVHALMYPINAFENGRFPGQTLILELAILVTSRILAARAQFPAQKNMGDTGMTQGRLQGFVAVLGGMATVRMGPHIGQRRDALLLQQADERLEVMTGMPDGIQG